MNPMTDVKESTQAEADGHEEEPPDNSEIPIPLIAPQDTTLPCLHLRKKTSVKITYRSKSTVKTVLFRRNYYPEVPNKLWNDWRWQIRNSIRSLDELKGFMALSQEESLYSGSSLPLLITPYYMSLLAQDNPLDPLRRSVVPTNHEYCQMPGESNDPLGEEDQSPVPGIVHRYPDRALFLVTDFCSTYCRYCTRSRAVGHGKMEISLSRLEKGIEYIKNTPAIRDVVVSGGDPLTMHESRLSWLLGSLRQISHVEIIRIGTKVPAVLPQRITPELVRMLKKFHPLWISVHFTHPDECTPEAYHACKMLADAGIPLGSQTVLLKGINDSVETMKALVHHLLKMRVKPYYLYQCDPIAGSSHFRTPIAKGLEIIRGLRGFTSGYAVPTYVIDAPGGGGKIPLMPDYKCGRDQQDNIIFKNYKNKLYTYPDCPGGTGEDFL